MSEIIITDDIETLLESIKYDEIILRDELKVDDIRELKEKLYLKEEKQKTIVLAAKKYNIISQNALLKILEEPPSNIEFILIATSKYALLDTIKSRLPVKKIKFNTKKIVNFSLKNSEILEFLKQDLEKDDIKNLIYSIDITSLNEEKLKRLNNAIKMIELNIDKKAILAYIFLTLKERD